MIKTNKNKNQPQHFGFFTRTQINVYNLHYMIRNLLDETFPPLPFPLSPRYEWNIYQISSDVYHIDVSTSKSRFEHYGETYLDVFLVLHTYNWL